MKRKFQHRGWAYAISREEAYALYEHYHNILDAVDNEIGENINRIKETQAENEKLRTAAKKRCTEIDELKKSLEDASRRIENLEAEKTALFNQVNDALNQRDVARCDVDRLTAEMRMRCVVCRELKSEWVVSTRCGHTLCLQCAAMPVCLRACPFCKSKDPLWMRIYPGTTEKD